MSAKGTTPGIGEPVYRPLSALFAKLLCAMTLLLIFAGGVVTSKNAGLSVPDWPTSFGYHLWAMPFSLWRGGALYEHSHRLIAMATGCVVLALTLWILASERRAYVRRLALAALAAVVVQGIFGGVTVMMRLPTYMSVLHGVLAQIFFCISLALAYHLSRERMERARDAGGSRGSVRPVLLWGLAGLVFAQLVLAAYMRHDFKLQGGVAVPDFPRMAGSWIPTLDAGMLGRINAWRADAVARHGAGFDLNNPVRLHQVGVHLAHRAMALVIVAAFAVVTVLARKRGDTDPRILSMIFALDLLVALQFCLGILTVWSNRGELITSLHVVAGAMLLGGSVLLALRAGTLAPAAPEDARAL